MHMQKQDTYAFHDPNAPESEQPQVQADPTGEPADNYIDTSANGLTQPAGDAHMGTVQSSATSITAGLQKKLGGFQLLGPRNSGNSEGDAGSNNSNSPYKQAKNGEGQAITGPPVLLPREESKNHDSEQENRDTGATENEQHHVEPQDQGPMTDDVAGTFGITGRDVLMQLMGQHMGQVPWEQVTVVAFWTRWNDPLQGHATTKAHMTAQIVSHELASCIMASPAGCKPIHKSIAGAVIQERPDQNQLIPPGNYMPYRVGVRGILQEQHGGAIVISQSVLGRWYWQPDAIVFGSRKYHPYVQTNAQSAGDPMDSELAGVIDNYEFGMVMWAGCYFWRVLEACGAGVDMNVDWRRPVRSAWVAWWNFFHYVKHWLGYVVNMGDAWDTLESYGFPQVLWQALQSWAEDEQQGLIDLRASIDDNLLEVRPGSPVQNPGHGDNRTRWVRLRSIIQVAALTGLKGYVARAYKALRKAQHVGNTDTATVNMARWAHMPSQQLLNWVVHRGLNDVGTPDFTREDVNPAADRHALLLDQTVPLPAELAGIINWAGINTGNTLQAHTAQQQVAIHTWQKMIKSVGCQRPGGRICYWCPCSLANTKDNPAHAEGICLFQLFYVRGNPAGGGIEAFLANLNNHAISDAQRGKNAWAWWNNPANFLPAHAAISHAIHGGSNPFGEECLLCQQQPCERVHQLPNYREGTDCWSPRAPADTGQILAMKSVAIGHNVATCPTRSNKVLEMLKVLQYGKRLSGDGGDLEADNPLHRPPAALHPNRLTEPEVIRVQDQLADCSAWYGDIPPDSRNVIIARVRACNTGNDAVLADVANILRFGTATQRVTVSTGVGQHTHPGSYFTDQADRGIAGGARVTPYTKGCFREYAPGLTRKDGRVDTYSNASKHVPGQEQDDGVGPGALTRLQTFVYNCSVNRKMENVPNMVEAAATYDRDGGRTPRSLIDHLVLSTDLAGYGQDEPAPYALTCIWEQLFLATGAHVTLNNIDPLVIVLCSGLQKYVERVPPVGEQATPDSRWHTLGNGEFYKSVAWNRNLPTGKALAKTTAQMSQAALALTRAHIRAGDNPDATSILVRMRHNPNQTLKRLLAAPVHQYCRHCEANHDTDNCTELPVMRTTANSCGVGGEFKSYVAQTHVFNALRDPGQWKGRADGMNFAKPVSNAVYPGHSDPALRQLRQGYKVSRGQQQEQKAGGYGKKSQCFNCGKSGHMATTCYSAKKGSYSKH